MAKSWSDSTPASGAAAMRAWKNHLVASSWTVTRSSDGTTYNASGDQITTDSGAGSLANTNAWMVLQSPAGAGGFQWCIQRGSSNVLWRVKFSRTAGFTAGSPAATVTPSATDEIILIGGGTDAAPTFASFFSTDGAYRLRLMADNASPYGCWLVTNTTGGSAPLTYMMLDPLTSTHASDAFLYVVHCAHNSNCLLSAGLLLETAAKTGASPAAALTFRASASPSVEIQMPGLTYVSAGSAQVIPNNGSTHPISTEDQPMPLLYWRRAALANPGYKGVSTMLKWNSISRTSGDTLNDVSTRDRIIMGDVSLDWSGNIPLI